MCIDLFGGPPNNLKNNSNKRDSEQTITARRLAFIIMIKYRISAKNMFERFSDIPELSLCFKVFERLSG